jgi:hypothetical protein
VNRSDGSLELSLSVRHEQRWTLCQSENKTFDRCASYLLLSRFLWKVKTKERRKLIEQAAQKVNSTKSFTETGLGSTLFHVVWLAILLGLAMETLLLLFTAGFEILPGFNSVVVDLIGKVSWSTIVCAGLAVGTAASKARAPLMGLLGVLAAPLAFHVSRTFQQGVAKTLEVAGTSASVGSQTLILLALLKALEYGFLGITINWIGRRPWGGVLAHAAGGLGVGILFGSAILSLTYWTAPVPLTAAGLFSRSINEILFPVGCSLVLYTATAVEGRVG